MQRWVTIGALLLAGCLVGEHRVAAQGAPEFEAEGSEPPIVTELPYSTPSTMEFDSSKLEIAQESVLRTRNWFLGSGAAMAVGWILLGAGISQCEWINEVEVCTRAGDSAGTAGAVIVTLSAVPLLVASIMYGIRSRQKKQLELATLRDLTEGGLHPPPASFDTYRLADAQDRIRKARNGLIASAALFGVGWIFLGVAIPRCESGQNELLCSGPGYAHLTIGLTLTGSGAIGMIVSGILLSVRKGNRRALERSIQRRQGAGLRWDPQSGAFVF